MSDGDVIPDPDGPVMGLIEALGGRRNVGWLSTAVVLIVIVSTLLTMLGTKQIWPGDRMSLIEARVEIVGQRLDSTNHALLFHQDSASRTRDDLNETLRALLVLSCDHVPTQRLEDLRIATKCRSARDGS